MCDMYGHGWWEKERGKVYENYLKCNSHREILRGDGKLKLQVLKFESSQMIKKFDSLNNNSVTSITDTIQEKTIQCIPFGVDPVNGRIVGMRQYSNQLDNIARLLIKSSWNVKFPRRQALFPWIENHFGKRGDEQNWMARGPLLIDKNVRQNRFKEATPMEPLCISPFVRQYRVRTSGQLIDALAKYPNEYWQQADQEDRYDKAKYVMDEILCN